MAANRKRTRLIRALMAEQGINYTRAKRIVDERAKARAEAEAAEADNEGQGS